jgi:hypothetical protein
MIINDVLNDALYKDIEYPIKPPIITIQGRTIATEQNFICLTGLPKTYKTSIMFKFIESALLKKNVLDIEVNIKQNDLIVCIDTEQGTTEYYRQIRNLKKNLRINNLPDNFKSYLFRKYEPDVIIQSIYEIVKTQKPKILLIDNLTELVFNPNDLIESKKIVQFLKTITAEFNLVIICLLHLGKQNLMSLGSLGSYADRGCQSSLKLVYDKETNVITLDATLMRSDKYFEPIGIIYDTDLKDFVKTDAIIKKSNSKKFILQNITDTEHKDRLRVIFMQSKQMQYTELIDAITKMYGIGLNIAKQQIVPYLRGNEFIISNDGIYTINKNK